MAAELMVINPVRRRRKMSAKQHKYFGKRRRVTRVRRNPVRKRRTVSTAASPVRRRRSRRRGRVSSFVRRSYSRARSSGIGGFLSGTLIPAGVGAAGALALDMAWGRLPIPDGMKTGAIAPVVRIAGAVGIGYLVSMLAGKKFGEEAMAGAITVTLYDLAKGMMVPSVPATPSTVSAYVDGLGYYSAAQNMGMGEYVSEYV